MGSAQEEKKKNESAKAEETSRFKSAESGYQKSIKGKTTRFQPRAYVCEIGPINEGRVGNFRS